MDREKAVHTLNTVDIPPPQQMAIPREVLISKATNGFIIKVGCQIFVSKDWQEVQAALAEYWHDPVAAEKKYCS
jgi:hypothetical protein